MNKCLIDTIQSNLHENIYIDMAYGYKKIILSKGVIYNTKSAIRNIIKTYSFDDINTFIKDYENGIIVKTPIVEENIIKINIRNMKRLINYKLKWQDSTLLLYYYKTIMIAEPLLKRFDCIEYLQFKNTHI